MGVPHHAAAVIWCWIVAFDLSHGFTPISSYLSAHRITTTAAIEQRHTQHFVLSTPTSDCAILEDSEDDSIEADFENDIDEEDELEIVPPNGSFRETSIGEVSITSMNVLAPAYHALAQPEEEQEEFAKLDRQDRYLKAISMAKKTNADILCLQEVEGGEEELNERLQSRLATDEDDKRGYDGCVFSPLLPNRKQDIVGLCVAWRTDRHRLVSCETFRRGMVVQLAEQSTGATIAIANLHLPAKPSAIEGRLRSMASAIRRIQTCEAVGVKRKRSALDGLAVVVGDFNCGHNAPAVKLLKTGYSLYGTIKDRNYKAKISKKLAANMKHVFRFQDVYDGDIRYDIAPVTVSLHGRGPGSMDHILYSASGDSGRRKSNHPSAAPQTSATTSKGRRQARRGRGVIRKAVSSAPFVREANARIAIPSILATVRKEDKQRLELIENGLPNEQAGFYSDHVPVGALFASKTIDVPDARPTKSSLEQLNTSRRGVVNQRRDAYKTSMSTRRRHNKVLRYIAEWLLERGATEMIRDVPLYKWKWLSSSVIRLTKKMRAPDLCCIVNNTMVVIEVTVSQKRAEEIYQTKVDKYQDVFEALAKSEAINEAGISLSAATMAIVLDENGQLCDESMNDIQNLANLASERHPTEACEHLCDAFREIVTSS